jgi:hypothetical protein
MVVNSATTALATIKWLGFRRSIISHLALYLGALGVLATGIDHIEQYSVDNYSTVPTIGTLFLLNFIASVVLTIGLIAPIERVAGRYSDAVRALSAVGGIGLGVLSLVGLFVSETSGLFGFVEHGYRMAILIAIVVEAAAVVFLSIFLIATGRASSPSARGRGEGLKQT